MVKRVLTCGGWGLMIVALMGAKGGNGCGAEYQPGDGSSAQWDVGTVPTAQGADRPMTCEWLESNNCWKQLAAAARACAPSGQGTFSAERDGCELSDGATFELAGPISTPADGSTLYPVVDQRLVANNGTPCFTGKILAVGRTAYAAGGQAAVLESKPGLTYRLICPDGSSYANDVEGTCENFGARWLAKQAPGHTFICQGGQEGSCEAEVWGADAAGPFTLVDCR
jgi:hypothetical protein